MKNYKSKVFSRAWELYRTTSKSFAVCLAKAWELYRLIKEMRKGIVSFFYEKVDGTLRRAKGTLQGVTSLIKGTGAESYKTVKYFDVEAQAFRSFRIDNLIAKY